MVPPMTPRRVATGATMRMSRAPAMTREKTSRPTLSVPNQWLEDGWARTFELVPKGSCGVRRDWKIAHTIQNPMIRAPTRKVLERRIRRQVSPRASWTSLPAATSPGLSATSTLTTPPGAGYAG